MEYIDTWLNLPGVSAVGSGPNHWAILRHLLHSTGTAGNLSSDAHVAALALENGCPIHFTDHDFARFPGIRHVNPLAQRWRRAGGSPTGVAGRRRAREGP